METRVCAKCGESLPSGVPDVFCPACALRGALAGGRQTEEGPVRRWFRQWTGWKEGDKSHEKPLASGENESKQSPPVATLAPQPGEVIGDYEILERIGGNMGLVFTARHRLLDKVVALKLLPADWIADPARLARFQREMRVMGQLEHPNLVTAADARSVGDWHLVAMELIDGVDLQQLVRTEGPLGVPVVCEIGRQAALALQYAHQHGLIHRDIKPSNLMLTRSGTIKLIDMGLALDRDDSSGHLTHTGLMLGTMSYCAPEQFRDAAHVDIRADIYSLGCTLFHLLTGKAPYWQRKSMAEVVEAHLHEPFPKLTEVRPDAPAELEAVLARMTAKERDARFSTPKEVVEALEPFVQDADLPSLVPAKTQPDPSRRVMARKSPSEPQRHTARPSQRPQMAWLLAALLVLFLAGGLFLAMNRSKRITLIDTMAMRGIYDDDNKDIGRSNSKDLSGSIKKEITEIRPEDIDVHSVDLNWDGRNKVRLHRPHLLIIHRSTFFHPTAAVLKFLYPDQIKAKFTNSAELEAELKQFDLQYKVLGDTPLCEFLADIGKAVPHTKFIVYSRGTDRNWLSPAFHVTWVKELESQYPWLKGRVETMLIKPEVDGGTATFRNPTTKAALFKLIRQLLGLPAKSEAQKPE